MKTKYYVCGLNGIISAHRKIECAEKKYKKIIKRTKYPTVAIRKKVADKCYQQEFSGFTQGYEWFPVKSLVVEY